MAGSEPAANGDLKKDQEPPLNNESNAAKSAGIFAGPLGVALFVILFGTAIFLSYRTLTAPEPVATEPVTKVFLCLETNKPFEYTMRPPRLAANAIDEFLFETRKGFCEHYAAAFTVVMRAQFTDTRTNEVLWSNDQLVFREEYDLQLQANGVVGEGATFLDTQGTAFDRISTDIARTVVTAILEAF